jgi:hypothetical protein
MSETEEGLTTEAFVWEIPEKKKASAVDAGADMY